jgi:hypothetical protein
MILKDLLVGFLLEFFGDLLTKFTPPGERLLW